MAGLTYRDAGVDIDAGDSLVERIKPHVKRTMRPEVMTDLGGFAGLCAIPTGYREPLLVSCTDGVGTKLKLAFLTGKHDTVGIDLVAMSVNDLVVSGAEPLFFLDYFASGKLDVGVAERVIAGIADGCQQAGCALVGGETAELPGLLRRRRVRPGRLLRRRRRAQPPHRRARHRARRSCCSAWRRRGSTPTATRWCAGCCSRRWRCGSTRRRPGWTRRSPTCCCARRASTCARCAGSRPPTCCAGRPTSPAAGSSTTRRACSRATPSSSCRSTSAAGRCRRCSSCSRAAAASRPTRCGARSTWGSACWSACRRRACAKRARCSRQKARRVFEVGEVAASDRVDAPVELRR